MSGLTLSHVTVVSASDPFVVTANANTGFSAFVPNTISAVVGKDGQNVRETLVAFGAQSVFTGYRANGTSVSPTALKSGDPITGLAGWGRGDTRDFTTGSSSIVIKAAQDWNDTACGTQIDFGVHPLDGGLAHNVMRMHPGGEVTVGDVNTGGTEKLQVTGGLLIDGMRVVDFASWPSYADDSAAALGGVAVNQSYRNGSVLQFRVA